MAEVYQRCAWELVCSPCRGEKSYLSKMILRTFLPRWGFTSFGFRSLESSPLPRSSGRSRFKSSLICLSDFRSRSRLLMVSANWMTICSNQEIDSYSSPIKFDGLVKRPRTCHCGGSRNFGLKKQSNYFNGLWEVRLLPPDQVRGRNDSLFEFLRDYQIYESVFFQEIAELKPIS